MLAEVDRLAQQVLAEAGLTPADVCAVGVGVPGPVEFSTGRPSHPPIMPGWHDYPIPSAFGRYECPVYVDNDVNVMALGEMGVAGSAQDVLVVKVGTGIGCGVIVDGRVYRGAQGSAGDIGHIYVAQPDGRTVVCRCGNENCLEAIAGGGALLRDAVAAGLPVSTTREVVELAAQGDGPALELVRDAGRTIGTVLAALVNFFNPHRIVMTGGVAQAGAPLLAGIREAVYGRSMPLAARALEITVSDAPDLSGRVGAALMAIEEFLDEDSVAPRPARVPTARAARRSGAWLRSRDRAPTCAGSRTVSRFGNPALGDLDHTSPRALCCRRYRLMINVEQKSGRWSDVAIARRVPRCRSRRCSRCTASSSSSRASGPWTASTSTSAPARCTACSARTAPASPR